MRVEGDRPFRHSAASQSSTSNISTRTNSNNPFEQELSQHRQDLNQERMYELIKEIELYEKTLKQNLSIDRILYYSKLVRAFLKEATSKAYLLQQERGFSRRGRTMLITINRINLEVEKVIQEFIQAEKEPIEILAGIDKIRGLLVDLMV